jgi:hypothetical protein
MSQTDRHPEVSDSIKAQRLKQKTIYSKARTASVMSALLPGLGQVYNRKYWKVPVIYAGLGGFSYLFYINNGHYNDYRRNVRAVYDADSTTVNTMPMYNGEDLQELKLYYRKYRDFSAIGFAIIYVLNIIDANVDAHLKTFDVSDDLSLNLFPWQRVYSTGTGFRSATGITVKLNFK